MKPTLEEVQQAIAELEKKGLVEWTGEWRPDENGILRKVYRVTDAQKVH
jgi:DNA-binding PadR family transcriptional regulator